MHKSVKIDKYFKDIIKNEEDKYIEDYKKVYEKMQKSNAIYKGNIIEFLYNPMFFDKNDIKLFENKLEILFGIINKVVKRYLNDLEFRNYFNFSKKMEELILIDPGYSTPVPIGRFDIFYDYNEDFKFCELNGDGSSAMNEANTVEEIMYDSDIIKKLRENFDLYYTELFDSWVVEILRIYNQFESAKTKPNVAIIDFENLGTPYEFLEFKKSFEKSGLKTIIADPRNLEYKNGNLWHENFRIDLAYRRAVNQEMEKRIEEVEDFIEAYRDKAFCMVGPFRSQIIHNKIFFEILTNEMKTGFLSKSERDFIEKHIPETYILKENTEMINKIMQNKDNYVLKPMDLYAAKGVYIGRDYGRKDWEEKINKALNSGDYLVQKFCIPGRKDALRYKGGKFQKELFKTTLGLFVYNENFTGLYSRLGKKNIIASRGESIVAPNFVVK
ncbi:MAG: hypothetical protein FXF47_05675 [Candidatus Mcinerneyibacterium aminivorans]|uniref:Glutathionylspermidine synthase pre-ATP-grasp-like domain-containing protein n=1 Tax=Candidatus Mcinerneyibacterium aminivorans TaxID=2703815 RepID=A0A5D0MDQ0_9BACT|nr:MAG: hypothetical protein FXF47_05675 [Candidatus Mcinerneyibacterium aminivorans]